MFYIGRVLDNTEFGKKGYIKVLLPQKYGANGGESVISQGLWKNLSSIDTLKDKGMSVECLVASPLGSGYNTGMFQMPQVNTVGLVVECLGEGPDPAWAGLEIWGNVRYIWLGGLYGCKRYNEKVIIPNDDTESEELQYLDKTLITENADDFSETESEEKRDTISDNEDLYKNSSLIIKTKTSYIKDENNPVDDDLNFKSIPGENTVVLNKKKIALRHNTNEKMKDGETYKKAIADIIENDDCIKINRIVGSDGIKQGQQTVTLDSDKITINYTNDKDSNYSEITLNSDGTINIKSNNNINVDSEKNIKMNSYGTSSQKMSDDFITLKTSSGGQINIDESQVTIKNNTTSLRKILEELLTVLDSKCMVTISPLGGTGYISPKQFENVKMLIKNLLKE